MVPLFSCLWVFYSLLTTNRTADFKMCHWVHGLTGSGDMWRCVCRAGCLVFEYLRASCHMQQVADRSVEVVLEQWQLAIWTLMRWTMGHSRCPVKFKAEEAYISCPACKILLAVSENEALNSDALRCPRPECDGNDPVFLVHVVTLHARRSTTQSTLLGRCAVVSAGTPRFAT